MYKDWRSQDDDVHDQKRQIMEKNEILMNLRVNLKEKDDEIRNLKAKENADKTKSRKMRQGRNAELDSTETKGNLELCLAAHKLFLEENSRKHPKYIKVQTAVKELQDRLNIINENEDLSEDDEESYENHDRAGTRLMGFRMVDEVDKYGYFYTRKPDDYDDSYGPVRNW